MCFKMCFKLLSAGQLYGDVIFSFKQDFHLHTVAKPLVTGLLTMVLLHFDWPANSSDLTFSMGFWNASVLNIFCLMLSTKCRDNKDCHSKSPDLHRGYCIILYLILYSFFTFSFTFISLPHSSNLEFFSPLLTISLLLSYWLWRCFWLFSSQDPRKTGDKHTGVSNGDL